MSPLQHAALQGCTLQAVHEAVREEQDVLVMLTLMYVCVLVVLSFIQFEIKELIGLAQVH